MAKGPTVEAWLAAQTPRTRALIQPLRDIVRDSGAGLAEHIKWNGPSFHLDGDDRITLGLAPKGGVRAVLHRGARAKDPLDLRSLDDSGWVIWAAPDRGVVAFADAAEVAGRSDAFADLCRRWLEATR